MIVVNPRNRWVKTEKCHFQGAIWDFFNFGLCNFFLVLFSGDPVVESYRSREVGLHKVPLVF